MRKVVLIVDDEFIILESLRIQLERFLPEEVSVESAHSGEEAIDLLKEFQEDDLDPLVVISDFNLGDAKGTDVLKEVKQLFPSAKRILLSGQAGSDAEIEAFIKEFGLDLFLSKPWDLSELRQNTEAFIAGKY